MAEFRVVIDGIEPKGRVAGRINSSIQRAVLRELAEFDEREESKGNVVIVNPTIINGMRAMLASAKQVSQIEGGEALAKQFDIPG